MYTIAFLSSLTGMIATIVLGYCAIRIFRICRRYYLYFHYTYVLFSVKGYKVLIVSDNEYNDIVTRCKEYNRIAGLKRDHDILLNQLRDIRAAIKIK